MDTRIVGDRNMKQKFWGVPIIIIILTILTVYPDSMARAGSMRQFQAIKSPQSTEAAVPDGFETIANIRPVESETIRSFMNKLAENWNSPGLSQMISDDFYDKSIFHDSMMTITKVPRDAKLKILAIQGIRTLQQMFGEDPEFGWVVVSVVEVTARTQIQLNDPEEGFVKLEGVNDYLLRVVQQKD
jgi:hypothetical protein